jgi:polyisoprenyl-phosphate glycosyltransferase
MEKIQVSFVIPIYNEEEVFSTLIDRLDSLMAKIDMISEVVLVDDGSKDRSASMMYDLALSDKRYHSVFLSRNFGHQTALTAGLDVARGNYIMILDADLQDPPELFFDFMAVINRGYDVVYGVRKNRKENFLFRFCYDAFYSLLSRVADFPIPKDSGDFCLMTRRAVNAIQKNREESRFIRGLRSWVGFRQYPFPYERQARFAGVSKYTFGKLFKLAYDGIFNFSSLPIRALTFIGVFFILISSVYFCYTLVRRFFFQDVPSGFTALLFIIILFGGFQFISIGIVGEYLYRAFFQVKNRPNYIISTRVLEGKQTDEQQDS